MDLYQMYRYCRLIGIRDIYVLTDLDTDEMTPAILKAICDDIVDVYIRTFLEDLQKTRYYHRYRPLQFLSQISDMVTQTSSNQLLLYYTGHGLASSDGCGCLKMPDSVVVETKELRNLLLRKTQKNTQMLWIFDCCNGSGLELPYLLESDESSTLIRYRLNNLSLCPQQRIVIFAAARFHQDANASVLGSVFTSSLLRLLKRSTRSLHTIRQTCKSIITSSYPGPLYLESIWVPTKQLRIDYDDNNGCLILERLN